MSATRMLAAALATLALIVPRGPAADLPPDLGVVPPDALAFVHVRAADIWKSEAMKDARDFLAKAGERAIRAFNDKFAPAPSSIDRLTVFVLPPVLPMPNEPPQPVLVITTSRPYDRASLLKVVSPQGAPREVQKDLFANADTGTAVRFVDATTFAVASPEAFAAVAAKGKAANGPLAAALAQAASGKSVVVGVNIALLPREALAQIPPQFQALARADVVTMVWDVGANVTVDLRARYAGPRDAAAAEEAARAGLQMAKQGLATARAEFERKLFDDGPRPAPLTELPESGASLVGLAMLGQYDELIRTLPLKVEGSDLRLTATIPAGPQSAIVASSAVSVGLLLPAVQKVREAAGRAKGQNNLKQMALAMHNYNDAYQGKMPAHAIYSRDGSRPLLSWRVAILPYIEQDNLYRQFKMDEPWDSENNKRLIPLMPEIYLAPNAPPTKEKGMTYYQVFVGGGAAWQRSPVPPGMPRSFLDGNSNTIMFAEAGEPVIWSKPDDLPYDPAKPLPKLGNVWNKSGFLVALADGSVRSISPVISEKTLRAAITAAGNEVLGPDW